MTTWASGYVADIPYTANYYRELSPAFLHFAAMAGAGSAAPDPERRLAYCELGCGQGVSANIIAAANPHIDVHAMDFNPAHIASAEALAVEAGLSNVHFYDDSFAEFIQRSDLPAFDVITLHGVLSWVSAALRPEIIAILRAKLAVGGLVYVSYNTMPGMGATVPLRRLLYEHAERVPGPILARVDAALEFAESVRKAGAGIFTANPALGARLDLIKTQDRAYVAHEYFNREWNCFYHSDVAEEMAEAKMDYVGSAFLAGQLDGIKLSPAQMALLASIEHRGLRETTRDSILNTEFRKDIFVRGARPLPLQQQTEFWLDTRFVLSVPRHKVHKSLTTNLGQVDLNSAVYEPVADALAQGPCTLRELLGRPQVRNMAPDDVRQALYILLAFAQVEPCLSAAHDAQRAVTTKAFNAAVIKRSLYSDDLDSLASPITGGGIPLDRFGQLLLSAWQSKEPDIPAAIWAILKPQGAYPYKGGRRLETEDEAIAEITERAEQFRLESIPVLTQLGII